MEYRVSDDKIEFDTIRYDIVPINVKNDGSRYDFDVICDTPMSVVVCFAGAEGYTATDNFQSFVRVVSVGYDIAPMHKITSR